MRLKRNSDIMQCRVGISQIFINPTMGIIERLGLISLALILALVQTRSL